LPPAEGGQGPVASGGSGNATSFYYSLPPAEGGQAGVATLQAICGFCGYFLSRVFSFARTRSRVSLCLKILHTLAFGLREKNDAVSGHSLYALFGLLRFRFAVKMRLKAGNTQRFLANSEGVFSLLTLVDDKEVYIAGDGEIPFGVGTEKDGPRNREYFVQDGQASPERPDNAGLIKFRIEDPHRS
jgi:hypothetical protein